MVARAIAALGGVAAALLAPAASSAAPPPPPNVPVTDTAPRAYQGPWLTVNPADPEQLGVSFQDGNSFPACWLGLSDDGGESWEQFALVGPGGEKPLPEGFYNCLRPSFAAGPDGTMYYAYIAGQGGVPAPNAIYLITSEDGGESFEDPVPIDTKALPPGNAGDANPRMAVDEKSGRLYVVWQQVEGMPPTAQNVLVSYSDDGHTFSSPVQLNAPDGNASTPNIAVGPDGRVYVTFALSPKSAPDPARPLSLQVAASADGGQSFGAAVTAQEEFNCSQRGPNTCEAPDVLRYEGRNTAGPQIAAGRTPGEAYLVSYGLESGLGNDIFRIRFSTSRDGGASWDRARTVGIAPGLERHHQIAPTISRAPNGRLDVVFYDLEVPSLLENTYLISSSDGGRSFGAPRLLSSAPSNTNIRPAFGFGQGPVMGSRLVASTDETIYSAWTDSRRGNLESAKLDIFSAKVSLAPPPRAAEPDPPEPEGFPGCGPTVARVVQGNEGGNTLVGTLQAEKVFAGAGNDVVEALAGDDCVDLGPGADAGHGGRGDDLLVGGAGLDRLLGSTGKDRIRGDDGRDRISGGRGGDQIRGGAARDALFGGASDDRITGGTGADRIAGNSGDDVIAAGSGGDRVAGGGGRDRLSGGSGNDRLSARDQRRDRIFCGKGRDIVTADAGDRVARDCEAVRRRS